MSPVKHFMRTATQDYTLAGGQEIKEGDWLLLSYQSANRDERVFDDPFTFDVDPGRLRQAPRLRLRAPLLPRAPTSPASRSGPCSRSSSPGSSTSRWQGPTAQTASVLVSGPKRLPVTYSFKG